MSGRIEFTMGFKTRKATTKDGGDTGFRIYLFGNFSGRASVTWDQRKIRKIDIDNFDRVMAEMMPALEIGSGSKLHFGNLEDFHPDVLIKNVRIMADLLQLKRDLSNPNTAAQAAAKIQAFLPEQPQSDHSIPPPQERQESSEDMLERLLGRRPEPLARGSDSLDKFIQRAVSPHISQDISPQHQDLIKVIEATISQFLRTLLHNPDFQSLEALWRATESLVNEERSDEQNFFLVDIGQAELLAEFMKDGRALEQKLLQHIQSGDGEQDVLLIGDYGFSDSQDHRDLLAFCSHLAKACDGCFVGGAGQSLIENIQEWRQRLEPICADHAVLSYPRYLQRLPYGAKRNPIEALAFEECSAIPRTDELLWANSAFLCARALIKSTQMQNSEQSGFFSDIPTFSFDRDGEPALQPGTETVLNETQANVLMSQGITPLIGFRQRQGVRVLPIVTLSEQH